MKKRLSVCLLLALLIIALAGCGQQGISKEPTPYVGSYSEGSRFKTLYFIEDHPDVVAVKIVVDETVRRLMNYDWLTSPDVEEKVLGNGQKWGPGSVDYRANQISFQLQSYQFDGIAYTLNTENTAVMASIEVKATIKFSSAAATWLELNGLKLGEDYAISLQVSLKKEDDAWVFRGAYPSSLSKK